MMPTHITYNGTTKSIREIERSFDMHQYAIYVGGPSTTKIGNFKRIRDPDLSRCAAVITFGEPGKASASRFSRRKGNPNVYPISSECTLFSDSEESGSEDTEEFKREVNKYILKQCFVTEDKIEKLKNIVKQHTGTLSTLINQQMEWNRQVLTLLGLTRL